MQTTSLILSLTTKTLVCVCLYLSLFLCGFVCVCVFCMNGVFWWVWGVCVWGRGVCGEGLTAWVCARERGLEQTKEVQ